MDARACIGGGDVPPVGKGQEAAMRSFLIFTVCLIAAPIPAAAKDAPATDAEKQEAMSMHIACLGVKADELDDGISDAGSVATAISTACTDTLVSTADIYARGGSDRLKRYAREQFISGDPKIAAQVVLAKRAKKRAAAD